ncbi:hypothetical protein LLT6_10905 [Lactococcus cremoris subsp. cremoris TIFN6]|uniref:Uncharacterized protein n=1 Tax=Lactococcus cremoris subsp. cremoris TIFN6 TaxID=1234876 RepID=T0S512_LACLC|nr:hypothetical protein LLT6_10905 [Lactococcus cremoris subsp. cremoris TIFN6]
MLGIKSATAVELIMYKLPKTEKNNRIQQMVKNIQDIHIK